MKDKYEFGVIAKYHDQPPFDTAACVWQKAKSITAQTTVSELIEWSGTEDLLNIEITLSMIVNTDKANDD